MFARCKLVLLAVVAASLFVVSTAQADTGDIIEPNHNPGTAADGWQAGNCKTDEPEAGEPKVKCSVETEQDFFRTAAGHPPVGFTNYIIKHEVLAPGVLEPIEEPLEGRDIKTLRVDLPPGLVVNPQSTTEKCSLTEFLHSPAPESSRPNAKRRRKPGKSRPPWSSTKPGSNWNRANRCRSVPGCR